MYINAAGIPMVFLNDFKSYNDLLHNRGDIYSDKPRMVMTGELCGAEYMVRLFLIECVPYDDLLMYPWLVHCAGPIHGCGR